MGARVHSVDFNAILDGQESLCSATIHTPLLCYIPYFLLGNLPLYKTLVLGVCGGGRGGGVY